MYRTELYAVYNSCLLLTAQKCLDQFLITLNTSRDLLQWFRL